MSVPCPGCRRAYPDDDRFAYGRTLTCACGARVARPLATGLPAPGAEPRFLADAMLARLARWLRVLGYDAAWEAETADADLVRRAVDERRLLLTRDRRLPDDWAVDNVLLLRGDDPLEQLREVVARLRLPWRERLFTRCTHCNLALRPAAPHEEAERLPDSVRRAGRARSLCPGCGRLYWEGGHVERMRRSLEEALGPPAG